MVDTTLTVDESTATMIRSRLNGQTHQFVTVDQRDSCLRLNLAALAALIAEILAEHTAALTAERDEITRESDLREQEIIALTVERDRALDQRAAILERGR